MNFEEFLKNYCFNGDGQGSNNTSGDGNKEGCNDIPGGFQDLNPEVFITIGEIIGNVTAGNLPFNVQNALGNWLQLIGQAILTYNAQQQYFQSGPGRYYNIKNKNATNPFCPAPSNSTSAGPTGVGSAYSDKSFSKDAISRDDSHTNKEICDLKKCIGELLKEVENLRCEIEELKKKGNLDKK